MTSWMNRNDRDVVELHSRPTTWRHGRLLHILLASHSSRFTLTNGRPSPRAAAALPPKGGAQGRPLLSPLLSAPRLAARGFGVRSPGAKAHRFEHFFAAQEFFEKKT
jgi:hypothetical protein